jgi:hypothetical protein
MILVDQAQRLALIWPRMSNQCTTTIHPGTEPRGKQCVLEAGHSGPHITDEADKPKTTNEAELKLFDLQTELEALPAKIKKLEEELQAAKDRRYEIARQHGELWEAQMAVRDAQFPVYREWGNGFSRTIQRVVAVDEKWITIREDRADKGEQYSVTAGYYKGARAPYKSYYRHIDHVKALEVWNKRPLKG